MALLFCIIDIINPLQRSCVLESVLKGIPTIKKNRETKPDDAVDHFIVVEI